MLNKLLALAFLVVLLLGFCGVVTAVLRPTIDTTAQTLVNHATQPDPLGDVLAVRHEAGNSGRTWATIGVILVILLVIGGAFGYLFLKPRMDKQKRLLLNAQRRGSQPLRSRVLPHFPQQDVRDLPDLQRARLVSHVPDIEEYD